MHFFFLFGFEKNKIVGFNCCNCSLCCDQINSFLMQFVPSILHSIQLLTSSETQFFFFAIHLVLEKLRRMKSHLFNEYSLNALNFERISFDSNARTYTHSFHEPNAQQLALKGEFRAPVALLTSFRNGQCKSASNLLKQSSSPSVHVSNARSKKFSSTFNPILSSFFLT